MPTGTELTLGARAIITAGKGVGWIFQKVAPVSVQRSLANAMFFPAIEQAGLLGSFKNRDEAAALIIAALNDAKTIKILSNKGDEWLGRKGLLTGPLLSNSREKRIPVNILLLDARSPWIQHRARDKGFWNRTPERVAADFEPAQQEVLACRENLPEMRVPRFHRHDPSWRFMMTDKHVFLQTYATENQIDKERVLHFSCDSPIYASASRYFAYLFELDSSTKDQISPLARLQQKTVIPELSAGLVVTRLHHGSRQILLLRSDGAVGLSKGGRWEGEELIQTAERELKEESGLFLTDTKARFLDHVLTGQPFEDEVSAKTIIFHHRHYASDLNFVPDPAIAAWYDAASLEGATPAYDYVPAIVAKVGISPNQWGERRV